MAETIFRGPSVVLGSLLDGRVEAFDGPSIGYQGDLIVNPIFSPQPKDGLSPGRVHGWYNAFYSVSVDAVPSASSSVTLANAAQLSSTANGLATGLITAVTGGTANVPWNCPGVPIQPLAGGAVVTCIAMDFGFSTGTTTANSSTIVVTDNRQFTLGQWLCLPGCGGTTTTPLFCQVMAFGTASPANATTLQVSPSPQTGLNNAPIGQANLYSQFLPYATQFGPSAPMPTATEPYRSAGLGAAMDPWASVARNLQYVSGAASGTGVIMVTGYDIYGQLMTEKVTLNSATPVRGLKAIKYIQSVQTITAATTGVATVSIGPDNSVGMNLRSDRWEFADIFYNGGFAINSQGWTAAVTTPATSTSGDVRGMINASTVLVGSSSGSAALGGPFDGVKRITIFQNVQLQNAIGATPLNYTSLIGVAQSIGT